MSASDPEAVAATLPPPRHRDDPGAPMPVEVRLSARACRAAIAIFMALISLPALLREGSPDAVRRSLVAVFQTGSAVPVVERLRAVEKRVDDAAWTRPLRAGLQTLLERVFREGNRKVLVGRDGWLFHRPGVQALTGRGPVLGPVHSVAKDPSLREWTGPIPVIREFADQLRERGLRLVLVPVPDKAAVRPDRLPGAGGSGPPVRLRHPDWHALVDSLRGAVEVVDLRAPLPYLRDDTHWEADGARMAAAAVAGVLRPAVGGPPVPATTVSLTDQGDLVALLGLTAAAATPRRTTLDAPVAPAVGFSSDASSSDASSSGAFSSAARVVLLGDSNVNMYDDPGLPFHGPGAGFASWLGACLGEPLHVIAVNGGGASEVRRRLAALPDDVVRAKEAVVWVLAERDLFMDPAVARANGVEWRHVRFNPAAASPPETGPPSAGPLVIEATVRSLSERPDVQSVVYPDSLFTAECVVDRVVAGTYEPKELAVVLWNFRNRVVAPTARLSPGQRLRLTLIPFLDRDDLTRMPLQDDLQRFDLELFFAERAELLPP